MIKLTHNFWVITSTLTVGKFNWTGCELRTDTFRIKKGDIGCPISAAEKKIRLVYGCRFVDINILPSLYSDSFGSQLATRSIRLSDGKGASHIL